ncbi:hypothetical protein G6O67_007169 [Ophiocordyceps sinensis]|uniref:Uncharacterized protein n=1 Tax=Ophiocordyceps sinensis TaxID=72228 RepID=A0A8H4PLK9_9HYPO|nr:hypothetical protein G6O67_007169 [Ophiocordyceps sinensis]
MSPTGGLSGGALPMAPRAPKPVRRWAMRALGLRKRLSSDLELKCLSSGSRFRDLDVQSFLGMLIAELLAACVYSTSAMDDSRGLAKSISKGSFSLRFFISPDGLPTSLIFRILQCSALLQFFCSAWSKKPRISSCILSALWGFAMETTYSPLSSSPSPSAPPSSPMPASYTRIWGPRAASRAQASPPSPNATSSPTSKLPRPRSSSSKPAGASSSMNMPDLSPRAPADLSLSCSALQSSGALRKGMSIEPEGLPRSNFLSDGHTSSSSSRARSWKNRWPSEARSIGTAASSSSPPASSSSFASSSACAAVSPSSSSSLVSAFFLPMVTTSPVSSLLSKTMRPWESIIRWFRSRPRAPPSSKSADAFLKRGSTANSSSNFLSCSALNEAAKVASDDLWVCG